MEFAYLRSKMYHSNTKGPSLETNGLLGILAVEKKNALEPLPNKRLISE